MNSAVHTDASRTYGYISDLYEESMASPAGSADGLEITARTARSAAVTFTDADVRLVDYVDVTHEKEFEFHHVRVNNPEPPSVSFLPTSTIIEIFEGVVQSVTPETMNVVLRAKRNLATPDHAMAIDLEYVQPQDLDLVQPGAVFYLTMFKETTGKTVRNVEEIRFRRQPNWNSTMLRRLEQLAAEL